MSRCHFGTGLFMIHSFSFKCESHWGGVCSSSEMYKKKISCWSGEAARGDTSFYFLNVCGLCSRENRRVCDQSCFAVMEEGEGGGGKNRRSGVFDAWREASVFRGTLEMKVVTRVGPLPAGTLHSRVGHQRIYNMYCKRHGSALRSGHVCEKVLSSRGRAGSCVIFSTAIELSYPKKHPFVLLHY